MLLRIFAFKRSQTYGSQNENLSSEEQTKVSEKGLNVLAWGRA